MGRDELESNFGESLGGSGLMLLQSGQSLRGLGLISCHLGSPWVGLD